jgi:hypothetical protein
MNALVFCTPPNLHRGANTRGNRYKVKQYENISALEAEIRYHTTLVDVLWPVYEPTSLT